MMDEETLDDIAEQNDCHGELERNTRRPRRNVPFFTPAPLWKKQLVALKSQAKLRERRNAR